MKKAIPTFALILAASAFTALAQEASTTPAAPAPGQHEGHRPGGPGGPGGPRDPMMRAAMEALTPAEREQLKAANQKVMEDPAVVEARQKAEAANKAFMEARRAALLKADPTIGPVLEKMEAAMKAGAPGGPQHKEHGKNAAPE